MNPACADANEQNTVKIEGEGHTVVFKQIAGLLARRIVFTKKVGDTVQRGERVGVMKFGSRMDVFLDPSASIRVKVGDHVKGGSSTVAFLPPVEENSPGPLRTSEAKVSLMENSNEQPPAARRSGERPRRRLRKGMYILPSMFTAANVLLGYFAILQVIYGSDSICDCRMPTHGCRCRSSVHFDNAAKAIGFAVLFDGLDGRIARMTGTTSDFGRELDSLADVITFGIAPALLAWAWGFHQISWAPSNPDFVKTLGRAGGIASFMFLIAGASRLARFNISVNPQPSNPGRPGKKYFVGMPIPAGAA